MANRAKAKGYRGEFEVLQLLQGVVNEVYRERGEEIGVGLPAPELQRSPIGRDIRGLPWISLEVKRHEPTNGYSEVTEQQKSGWWTQCKTNTPAGSEPVLIYRANFQPWKVRMFARLETPGSYIRCPVDVSVEAFLVWFRLRVRESLAYKADKESNAV